MKAISKLMMASALALVTTSMAFANDVLNVGDKAPVVKVAGWAKGTPVTEFKKGKIYVVEFWATWCGPCKESIPHLTELAKKFKDKVTFTGVSVWERDPAYAEKVKKFVADMGAKMEYNVAIDDDPNGGTMAKKWMMAAKQNGIPSAFIINGDGVVAWVGHPMEMEKPLADVVAGKWDVKAAAAKFIADNAKAEAMQTVMASLGKAMGAKKYDEALKIIDDAVAKNPELKDQLGGARFKALFETNLPKALEVAKSAPKETTDPGTLFSMAGEIANKTGLKKEAYDLVAPLCDAITKNLKKEFPILDITKATAYTNAGDKVKARECLEKGLKSATEQKQDRMIAQIKQQLDALKS